MIELTPENPLTVERIKKWQKDTNLYPLINNRLDYRLLDANLCIDWLMRKLKEAENESPTIKGNIGNRP